MKVIVLDSSVIAKWFLPAKGEPFSEEAFDLLRQFTKGQIHIIVPDLFWAEFGNLMWKAVRKGRCTIEAARSAIASLAEHKFPSVSSQFLLPPAFGIAIVFERTLYDSLYVALAIESKGQFITADERLANALAAHLPVKWLGAL